MPQPSHEYDNESKENQRAWKTKGDSFVRFSIKEKAIAWVPLKDCFRTFDSITKLFFTHYSFNYFQALHLVILVSPASWQSYKMDGRDKINQSIDRDPRVNCTIQILPKEGRILESR